MSLFQNFVLNKYLKGLDMTAVNEAYQIFTEHFHNPVIQENIRNSNEEQYQGEFLIDLFVKVFTLDHGLYYNRHESLQLRVA